mgnify:FL=1
MAEVLANAAGLEFDVKFLLDQLAHSSPTPEVKVHLELLGALVDDRPLGRVFLRLAEHPTVASATPAQGRSNGTPAAGLEGVNGATNGRVALRPVSATIA